MHRRFLKQFAVVAVIGLISATNASAGGGAFTRGCAARDMQIIMMLEQSESIVSTQQFNDAVTSMLQARMVCFDGRVADALGLYDDIARNLTSDWASSSHPHVR